MNFNFKTVSDSQISQEIIKLKRSGDKIFNDPLNYMIEFIITYEKSFGIENPFYAEHKRFAFFAFIIQLYHQAGDYNIDHRIGYFCLQYFMENPDKLDLDQIYESDAARFLMRDELEIKKSECLMQIMRFLPDGAEANPYIDKLLASHSTLFLNLIIPLKTHIFLGMEWLCSFIWRSKIIKHVLIFL